MYVQIRTSRNGIQILAANVENRRFEGNILIIDMNENNTVTTKVMRMNEECGISKKFDLNKHEKSGKMRFLDSNNFK